MALNFCPSSWSTIRVGPERDPAEEQGLLSPHELRHGSEFTGLLLPFGSEAGYLPPGYVRKAAHKFAPKSRKGLFLGWHMLLGGKWSGDYIVADLADFEEGRHNARVYQFKELIQPNDINSPLAGIAKHVELISPG